MSLDDFCRCTPPEFQAIFNSWEERESNLERGMWERARIECMCSLQPYSKKPLTPRDIMELPWDEEQSTKGDTQTPIDDAELLRRFEEVKARYGLR